MNDRDHIEIAHALFQEGYECQMEGEIETAIDLYRRSIEAYPTAEAHTHLGWTYSFQGRLDDAIAECKKAILIDPDFGNPYNDIGTYLIEKSQYEEAIPWLMDATGAKKYTNHHFAHYNLARAYIALELLNKAKDELEKALHLSPEYETAREALLLLKRKIH
jgi:tetratricopeptide (TPR) repeat protein